MFPRIVLVSSAVFSLVVSLPLPQQTQPEVLVNYAGPGIQQNDMMHTMGGMPMAGGAGMPMSSGPMNSAMPAGNNPEKMLQMLQQFLERYAPDSWVNAWNGISQDTKLCWLKAGMTMSQKIKQGTSSPQSAMANVQNECQADQAQMQAFAQAVQASIQQLPDKLKQIGQQLCDSLHSGSPQDQHYYFQAFTTFFSQLKALTPADRQQIAAVFPKLSNVITAPEWDQAFDGSNSVVNGAEQVTNAFQSLYHKLP
jgi:hypothetical protein